MEGGGTNGVARDPETRGKVIPTGPPPCGSQLMGRNGPGCWGRHAVAEPLLSSVVEALGCKSQT